MLSCNDVISPPLWVLPLVHSPQYLSHLWELAEEARDVSVTQTYTHTHTHTHKQTNTHRHLFYHMYIFTQAHINTNTNSATDADNETHVQRYASKIILIFYLSTSLTN